MPFHRMQMVLGTDDANSSFRRPPPNMISSTNVSIPQSKPTFSRNGIIGLNTMFQNIRVNTSPSGGGCGCGK
uniref:Uncharacterized protein n=1 Tax=viral metagenome TaxID=1070528 RepID=A0A6C0LDV1_9ZZZZ